MAAKFTITFTITNNLLAPLVRVSESMVAGSGKVVGAGVPTVAGGGTQSINIVYTTNSPSLGVNGNLVYQTTQDGRIGFITFIFKSNTAGTFATIISDNEYIDVKYQQIGHGTPFNLEYTVG